MVTKADWGIHIRLIACFPLTTISWVLGICVVVQRSHDGRGEPPLASINPLPSVNQPRAEYENRFERAVVDLLDMSGAWRSG